LLLAATFLNASRIILNAGRTVPGAARDIPVVGGTFSFPNRTYSVVGSIITK
jgi:hypothetical protein